MYGFLLVLGLGFSTVLTPPVARPPDAQVLNPNCVYILGFKTLHDMIPATVGDCRTDEYHNPANGDGLQLTAGGLLAWRKCDNWTAFTNGATTWINGPTGLVTRANQGPLFPFESANCGTPAPAPPSPAPPSATTGVQFTLVDGGPPGGRASVTVQTAPAAYCDIDYLSPAGTASNAPGLLAKYADDAGRVSWTWILAPSGGTGSGTVAVTCNGVRVSTPIRIG